MFFAIKPFKLSCLETIVVLVSTGGLLAAAQVNPAKVVEMDTYHFCRGVWSVSVLHLI